jgi:hypothetical protein
MNLTVSLVGPLFGPADVVCPRNPPSTLLEIAFLADERLAPPLLGNDGFASALASHRPELAQDHIIGYNLELPKMTILGPDARTEIRPCASVGLNQLCRRALPWFSQNRASLGVQLTGFWAKV